VTRDGTGTAAVRSGVAFADGSAQEAMAAAVRDVAQLLDVDVDQCARDRVLVAADRLSGGAVAPGEPVEPAAEQDAVHGRGRQADLGGNVDRAQAVTQPQPDDLADQPWGRAGGAVPGPAGTVGHASWSVGLVAKDPSAHSRPGALEPLGSSGMASTVLHHSLGHPQASTRSQTGVSVGHEDLRVGVVAWQLHTSPGGPHSSQLSYPCTNLPGQNS
jgi:hypothetical protein